MQTVARGTRGRTAGTEHVLGSHVNPPKIREGTICKVRRSSCHRRRVVDRERVYSNTRDTKYSGKLISSSEISARILDVCLYNVKYMTSRIKYIKQIVNILNI